MVREEFRTRERFRDIREILTLRLMKRGRRKSPFSSPFLAVANQTAVEVPPGRCDADCFGLNTVESAQTQIDPLTRRLEPERLGKKRRSADTQPHPEQSLLGFLGVFVETLGDVVQRQQHPLQSEVPN